MGSGLNLKTFLANDKQHRLNERSVFASHSTQLGTQIHEKKKLFVLQ